MNSIACEFEVFVAAPGSLRELTSAYAERLHERQAHLIGAWTCEFGPLNRLVTLSSRSPQGDLATLPGLVGHRRQTLSTLRWNEATFPCAVIEFRTYATHPGRRAEYLERMLPALSLRERHSPNLGVWCPDPGNADEVIHLWGYPTLEHRMRARASSFEDPHWRAYLQTVYPLLADMRSEILLPVSFSPLQ